MLQTDLKSVNISIIKVLKAGNRFRVQTQFKFAKTLAQDYSNYSEVNLI